MTHLAYVLVSIFLIGIAVYSVIKCVKRGLLIYREQTNPNLYYKHSHWRKWFEQYDLFWYIFVGIAGFCYLGYVVNKIT